MATAATHYSQGSSGTRREHCYPFRRCATNPGLQLSGQGREKKELDIEKTCVRRELRVGSHMKHDSGAEQQYRFRDFNLLVI